ncbi:acetylornithine transaminase [Methylotuvimicrobium alcaliphilum]|uniref:Acetylornithine aminotransferase n=1 Tax=Methylotuvimicrobium alcaliphilum (strain DSM 19304 / NCIMB 14124 / VKM B-2133 / 20Z) TaxID=1091494 RepID=G4T1Q2_META2|nr:acetylornithine transaminase [Methylotuvimicrobium alcaliphilum]CCE23484.1 succinylornithine transaminase, also has acetylornitine transaminase activity, PLP-dependent [Methylotuvimicrobium alcaliphilum 20Z]
MTGHIMPTYGRLSISLDRGEGAWLWDQQGNCYLDALSGIAVCNLGHAHPSIHKAICEQSAKLVHTSNLYRIDLQEQLADRLTALSGMDNAFFCNSGAEANEAAIKIARRYGHQKDIENPAIIVMEKSFHGRTLATLSATGNTKIQQGFAPLVEGFIRVPYNDITAIKNALQQHSNVVAILIEPIQGEGGVNIPAPDYLNNIRTLCDRHDLLMMLDEIQTGIGRTGKFLAYQHNDILPDVCTLAKALANGVPIGACLARGKAEQILTPGTHGSTFGGNPLACSAALAVLNELNDGHLIEQAEIKGRMIASKLDELLVGNNKIVEIRHKGLMIGVELSVPCGELVSNALSKGLLINVTNEKTIRLLPPLIIDAQQIERLVETLTAVIQEFTEKHQANEP